MVNVRMRSPEKVRRETGTINPRRMSDIDCAGSWYRRAIRSLLIGSLLLCAGSIDALDENRLWLPKSWQRLYLDLKSAALNVEAMERCDTVLEGTVDIDRSTEEQPIFRIRCRQRSGKTFVQVVGLEQEEDPRETEIEEMKREMWVRCERAFQQKTRLMNKVSKLGNGMPEPDPYTENLVKFVLDFDSEGVQGEKLQFRAVCTIKKGKNLKMSLGRRPTS